MNLSIALGLLALVGLPLAARARPSLRGVALPLTLALLLGVAWDLACRWSGSTVFPPPADTWAAFGELVES